jgi:hypothetical protein
LATLNFIKGTVNGKLGVFVGSSWKGKSYIKTFTPPGNPRTADQVAVRSVFQHTARFAKAIYEGVLKPYTFPVPQKMTAYNRMIQINKPMFDDKVWDPSKLKIFDGPLYNPGITSTVFSSTANDQGCELSFKFSSGPDKTDLAIIFIYDEDSGSIGFSKETRGSGVIGIDLPMITTFDKNKLHSYLVFVRPPVEGTGEQGMVSSTAYKKVT